MKTASIFLVGLSLFFFLSCATNGKKESPKDAPFHSSAEAADHFSRTFLKTAPLPGAYASLALSLLREGRVAEAIENFQKEFELYGNPRMREYIEQLRRSFPPDV